jgi:hypothetical protein
MYLDNNPLASFHFSKDVDPNTIVVISQDGVVSLHADKVKTGSFFQRIVSWGTHSPKELDTSALAARGVFYGAVAKALAEYGVDHKEIEKTIGDKVLENKPLLVRDIKRELAKINELKSGNFKEKLVARGIKDIAKGKKITERLGESVKSEEKIGRFSIVREKEKGVEPGFIAKKVFTKDDWQKLIQNSDSSQRKGALASLERAKSDPNSRLYKEIDAWLKRLSSKSAEALGLIANKNRAEAFLNLLSLNNLSKDTQIQQEFFKKLDLVDSLRFVRSALKEAVVNEMPKFQKLHYIKGDYKESDTFTALGEQYVRVPVPLSKGPVHRMGTAKTRSQANQNAVREALANDLMGLFMLTQKLKIQQGAYADGYPKLILDGTHMMGPDGESFCDFNGWIEDGYLVKEAPAFRSSEKALTSDDTLQELGRSKIFFLLMGDRDAIGSRGDNKGRVGNFFAAIDPGHSLEKATQSIFSNAIKEDLMLFKNINSDFSFQQPEGITDIISGGFKNFTIFDDTDFLEKMEGVRKLRDLRENEAFHHIFESYRNQFSQPPLDFSEEINDMEVRFNNRLSYILDDVFASRLKFVDTPKALTVLDRLEKLTSEVSETSPNDRVKLHHLRVVKRTEWSIEKDVDGSIVFSSRGANVQEAYRRIASFISAYPPAVIHTDFRLENNITNPAVLLRISPEGLEWLESVLGKDETSIRDFHRSQIKKTAS